MLNCWHLPPSSHDSETGRNHPHALAEQICKSAAQKLSAAAPQLGSVKATVGFDGFVDEIIAVVDKRHDFERFDSVRTISVFGGKIVAAAGQSSNYELIVKQMKLGGNGPIMANALASAGLGVTYVGNLGYPNVHPVFQEFLAVRQRHHHRRARTYRCPGI